MNPSVTQEEVIAARSLRWPWAIVIVCGLLLGYYVSSTYFTPKTRQYQLDFGKAMWIEPAEAFAPIAYFRKEVYLSALPEQAWMEIAASDNFGLIINGHTVGTLDSVKTYKTGITTSRKRLRQAPTSSPSRSRALPILGQHSS